MKIVINRSFGGFGISKEAAEFMAANGSPVAKEDLEEPQFYGYGITKNFRGYDRQDPYLIQAVETLGKKANGSCAQLKVVEIPDYVDYEITDYDGKETIREVHQTWS